MTIKEYYLENCRAYIKRKYPQLSQQAVDGMAADLLNNKLIFISKSIKSNDNIKPLTF